MICCVHACTGTNTANLSGPTACMNHSITSTLPRTWQDINRSLDPTATSNSILWSHDHRTPPFEASRHLFIEWRWRQNYIAWCILAYGTYQKGRVSLRAQGAKQQVIFHCVHACPKINHVMLWNKVTGSLPPKLFANLAVTFFGFAAVLSTCCCGRHVKEDDRVFQYFILQRDKEW
jgi:hypothetical protein